jgi:bacteriorhodopsin
MTGLVTRELSLLLFRFFYFRFFDWFLALPISIEQIVCQKGFFVREYYPLGRPLMIAVIP